MYNFLQLILYYKNILCKPKYIAESYYNITILGIYYNFIITKKKKNGEIIILMVEEKLNVKTPNKQDIGRYSKEVSGVSSL